MKLTERQKKMLLAAGGVALLVYYINRTSEGGDTVRAQEAQENIRPEFGSDYYSESPDDDAVEGLGWFNKIVVGTVKVGTAVVLAVVGGAEATARRLA